MLIAAESKEEVEIKGDKDVRELNLGFKGGQDSNLEIILGLSPGSVPH